MIVLGPVGQSLHHGKREGGSLSGAGMRGAQDVTTLQSRRDGESLNFGRLVIADLEESVDEAWGQPELREGGARFQAQEVFAALGRLPRTAVFRIDQCSRLSRTACAHQGAHRDG